MPELSWQIVLMAVMMVVGAVIDGWKLKVPNWLTYPMIVSGWLVWGVTSYLEGTSTPVLYSLGGTFLAGFLVLIPYLVGGMGAGDVKLYAGFGAWMVPIPWFGFQHLMWAFAYSVVLGGVMGLAIMFWNRTVYVNMENIKDIMTEWQTSGSLSEIRRKGKERVKSAVKLPYGIPLTIGSLAYVAYILAPYTGTY